MLDGATPCTGFDTIAGRVVVLLNPGALTGTRLVLARRRLVAMPAVGWDYISRVMIQHRGID